MSRGDLGARDGVTGAWPGDAHTRRPVDARGPERQAAILPPYFDLEYFPLTRQQVPFARVDSFAACRSTLQVNFLTMSQRPVSADLTGDFKQEQRGWLGWDTWRPLSCWKGLPWTKSRSGATLEGEETSAQETAWPPKASCRYGPLRSKQAGAEVCVESRDQRAGRRRR